MDESKHILLYSATCLQPIRVAQGPCVTVNGRQYACWEFLSINCPQSYHII